MNPKSQIPNFENESRISVPIPEIPGILGILGLNANPWLTCPFADYALLKLFEKKSAIQYWSEKCQVNYSKRDEF